MAQLMSFLSTLVTIYMMIVSFRIILTWFSWMGGGSLQNILARITDPYLNWFRRFSILRIGYMDFSPIAALAVLSLINRIFSTIAFYKTITLGIILVMVLEMFWSAVSFLIGFFIIVLVLRLIAHLARFDIYNRFWRIVDTISQPVCYKINRLLFKNRIVNYTSSLLVSIAGLGLIYLVLRMFVFVVAGALARLPV